MEVIITLTLSFQSIEEVVGYVLIAMNDAAIVPLGNLRLIRGQSLYDGEFALLVMSNYKRNLTSALNYSGLRQLQLSNLSGETHTHTHSHSVYSNDVFCVFCHQKSSGEG